LLVVFLCWNVGCGSPRRRSRCAWGTKNLERDTKWRADMRRLLREIRGPPPEVVYTIHWTLWRAGCGGGVCRRRMGGEIIAQGQARPCERGSLCLATRFRRSGWTDIFDRRRSSARTRAFSPSPGFSSLGMMTWEEVECALVMITFEGFTYFLSLKLLCARNWPDRSSFLKDMVCLEAVRSRQATCKG